MQDQALRLTRPLAPGAVPLAAGRWQGDRRDVIDLQAYRAESLRPTPPTPPSGGRAA